MNLFYSTFAMLILTFGIGLLTYLPVNGKCILSWECSAVSDVLLCLAVVQPVVFSAVWDSFLVSPRRDLAGTNNKCLKHWRTDSMTSQLLKIALA
eukprot:12438226-Ditylum_brightwellii.AAC.1